MLADSLDTTLSVAKSSPSSAPPLLRPWGALLVLIVLTVAGGLIRFSYLDQPALWGDEAKVYWRICGTYGELISVLREDGFVPLHYEINWVIGHFFKPTPFVIRFLPALCGTLMVPAIYFLAVQLVQRSTALLAAAFAACSGFLIFYSRDAKMYSDAWLFVTLNAGCIFWWLRSRSFTSWLCWVAAGCAACGLHPTALAVVGLSPLMLLTQRTLHWKTAVWWMAGALIIISGPVVYYTKFNVWNQRVDERGWNFSGIEWVDNVNEGKDGFDLVRWAGTSYLMGWSWSQPEEEHSILPWLVSGPKLCSQILLSVLIVALFPWPLATRANRQIDPPPQPQWRVFLWLGLWILLPAYAFYCHSIDAFYSPTDWMTAAVAQIPAKLSRHPWIEYAMGILALAAVIVAAARIPESRPLIVRGLQWTLTAAALWLACYGLYKICYQLSLQAMLENRPWHSVWIPRYLAFIFPGVIVATAALLMRLPTRPVRAAAIIFLLGINLAFGAARVFGGTEPPVDHMAADLYADYQGRAAMFIDTNRGDPTPGGGTLMTDCGRYYFQMLKWTQPISPMSFRLPVTTETRVRRFGDPQEIVQQMSRSRRTDRLVVWDEVPERIVRETDRLAPMLKGWKPVREDWYTVREFWDFEFRGTYRRREYVRIIGTPARNGR